MPEERLAVVGIFNNQMEADIAVSVLDSAGIEATIQADSVGGFRPHLAWANGGFKLLVREEDEAASREALKTSVE